MYMYIAQWLVCLYLEMTRKQKVLLCISVPCMSLRPSAEVKFTDGWYVVSPILIRNNIIGFSEGGASHIWPRRYDFESTASMCIKNSKWSRHNLQLFNGSIMQYMLTEQQEPITPPPLHVPVHTWTLLNWKQLFTVNLMCTCTCTHVFHYVLQVVRRVYVTLIHVQLKAACNVV